MIESAPDHRKMKRLARRLNIWHVTAVGIMECFWNAVNKFHPDGNIASADAEAIAEWCKVDLISRIEPQSLVDALVDSGFLDRIPAGTRNAIVGTCTPEGESAAMLLVHDWPEHCYKYTHYKIARKMGFFADGTAPSLGGFWDRGIRKADLEEFYKTAKTAKSAGANKADAGTNKANAGTLAGTRHVPTKPKRAHETSPPTPTPTPIDDVKSFVNGETSSSSDTSAMMMIHRPWLETKTAVAQRFQSANGNFFSDLVHSAYDVFTHIANPQIEFTDAILAAAVEQCSIESPSQQSAGLYLRTVPAMIEDWAKNGRKQPIKSAGFVAGVTELAKKRIKRDGKL